MTFEIQTRNERLQSCLKATSIIRPQTPNCSLLFCVSSVSHLSAVQERGTRQVMGTGGASCDKGLGCRRQWEILEFWVTTDVFSGLHTKIQIVTFSCNDVLYTSLTLTPPNLGNLQPPTHTHTHESITTLPHTAEVIEPNIPILCGPLHRYVFHSLYRLWLICWSCITQYQKLGKLQSTGADFSDV